MPYIWKQKNWPRFTWQNDKLISVLSKARFAQGKLLSKVGILGLGLSKESRFEILVEETMKTAAIEGQKLNQEAVRSSVAGRLGVPSAGIKAVDKNAEGLIDVILDATGRYKKPLTTERLKSWQAALFPSGYSGLRKIRVGRWRGKEPMQVVSGAMGREKVHFEAPSANKINAEMKKFVHWWKIESKDMDGLIRAGVSHFYFVTVHPFEDGNGRIARAISEMALAGDEKSSQRYYSLSARIMKERKAYYNILEKSQKGTMDVTEWLKWFLSCFLRALEDSEITISRVLNISDFWHKHAGLSFNKNQRKVINRLLESAPEGFKGGLTTRKYVAMTKVSRATAYRDISDLVEKGVLKQNKGKGRSVSYGL